VTARRIPGRLLHADMRERHARALSELRTVDAELGELLDRRRRHLAVVDDMRDRLTRRSSGHHGGVRGRCGLEDAPIPPVPDHARPLEGVSLRAVCLRLLARHGPHRLRDLHGLLHCYGYAVAGPDPVKRLGDAMAYECQQGRVDRIDRATYRAVPGAEVPQPRWLGVPPPPADPLPWSRPVADPGPPLVDPDVADDPILWSGGGYPSDDHRWSSWDEDDDAQPDDDQDDPPDDGQPAGPDDHPPAPPAPGAADGSREGPTADGDAAREDGDVTEASSPAVEPPAPAPPTAPGPPAAVGERFAGESLPNGRGGPSPAAVAGRETS